MRLSRALPALALALAGVASAQPDDAASDPRAAWELGRARLALYRTLLDLEIRYLERTIPSAAYGPEAAFYLARCQLLAARPARAIAAIDRPLAPPRVDAELHCALVALVRRAAAGELDATPPSDGELAGISASGQLRIRAEHAFLLAAVAGYPREAAALAREVEARAAREGLPLVAAARRCLAYCALRVGDRAMGRRHLAPLLPLEPELRLPLEEFAGGEDGRVLATEVACYAPDVLLSSALAALGPARGDAADPVDCTRAALAVGDVPDGAALDRNSPWRIALGVRALGLAPEPALVAPALADPARRPLLEVARALEEVLGRADLALPLRQRAFLLLRERGFVRSDGTIVDPPVPIGAPGESPPVRLSTLSTAQMLELAPVEAAELAACALDASDPATRLRAVALHDALYAHARRANLWEFDLGFLARLARAYAEAGRFDALTGYLFRRPTLPELEVCAAAARTMARELEAFAAMDRQASVVRTDGGAGAPDLEPLLYGATDPRADYLPRPTPRVDLGGGLADPPAASTPATDWLRAAADEAARWAADPRFAALAGLALVAWGIRYVRRRRILARYPF